MSFRGTFPNEKLPEVFAGLDAALQARLLEECRGAYGGRFAFVHALIRQTLYEELPAHRRRRLHLHVGETKAHAVQCRQRWGTTLVGRLQALGVLGPRVSMAHGVWLDDAELRAVAAAGATIVHNPASNLKLGNGVARVRATQQVFMTGEHGLMRSLFGRRAALKRHDEARPNAGWT